MIKWTIKYKDYNGKERTEDKFFHVSKRKLVKWASTIDSGGLEELLKKIIEEEDREKLITMIDDLILMAYGEKSEDGREFIQNDKIRERFENSAAYETLFYDLLMNNDSLTTFVNGLIPDDIDIPNDELERVRMGLIENAGDNN